MAYLINPEDQDLLDSVREFCEKEIKEQCKEYDVSGEWPAEIYKKAAELGYNGLEVPEEYGGLGLERITVAALMEEFAKADAGFVTTITASNLALKAVLIGGNEEQKQHCCDLLMEGNHGAFEASLIGTKLAKPEEPLEIIRTIHSFDPCLACATHLLSPKGEELCSVKVR